MLMTMLVVVTLLAIAVVSVVLLIPDSGKVTRGARAGSEVESMKAALERRMREGGELRF